jgi:hypothetical protein
MEPVRIVISAEYSEFKTFLNDILFRLYGGHVKNATARNDNDLSTHLEYVANGVIFDYKILPINGGLDIIMSYWAEVIHDEDKGNIQKHIEDITEEIKNKFHSVYFPLGFKNLILDDEHSKLMEDLWVESEKTQEAKAYLSTIVILGSILEGLLLYKIKKTPENLKKANRSGSSPKETVKGKKKVLPISKWTLRDMIQVSRECGWINEYSYNFSESLRKHRNFIHPFQLLDEMFTMPDENACDLSRTAFTAIFNDLLKNTK